MAMRINNFVRRLINLKGFTFSDISLLSRNISSYSSSNVPVSSECVKKYALMSMSSANIKENIYFKYNFSIVTPPKLQILDRPVSINTNKIIDFPLIKPNIRYEDQSTDKEIEEPKPAHQEEKHAVRMIVIRKKKMRVHKLKKWRKKMEAERKKYRQMKKAEKEKVFQIELWAKIKEAQKFDPAVYVKQQIGIANKEIIPTRWKGKRLPEFIVRDLIELRNKKNQLNLERRERRKNMNLKASDY